MTRVSLALVVVATTACNQAFGLEDTVLDDGDPDGDGFTAADNCRSTFNPDQADRDHDGIGDACDTCPDLSTPEDHDEDNDLRGDACDACPSIADFNANADGDDLGDACDSPSTSRRVLFDNLMTFDPGAWQTDTTWQQGTDAIAPVAPTQLGLTDPEIIVEPIEFWIRAGFVSRTHWSVADSFGIIVHDASGATVASCIVGQCDGTHCTLTVTAMGISAPNATTVDPMPNARMRLFVTSGGGAKPRADCSLEDTPTSVRVIGDLPQLHGTPTWITTPNVSLSFVEVGN